MKIGNLIIELGYVIGSHIKNMEEKIEEHEYFLKRYQPQNKSYTCGGCGVKIHSSALKPAFYCICNEEILEDRRLHKDEQ
jgi:hypothetical protein